MTICELPSIVTFEFKTEVWIEGRVGEPVEDGLRLLADTIEDERGSGVDPVGPGKCNNMLVLFPTDVVGLGLLLPRPMGLPRALVRLLPGDIVRGASTAI